MSGRAAPGKQATPKQKAPSALKSPTAVNPITAPGGRQAAVSFDEKRASAANAEKKRLSSSTLSASLSESKKSSSSTNTPKTPTVNSEVKTPRGTENDSPRKMSSRPDGDSKTSDSPRMQGRQKTMAATRSEVDTAQTRQKSMAGDGKKDDGKIKVVLRIRPRFKAEGEDCVEVQSDERSIVISGGSESSTKAFIYDAILDSRIEGQAGGTQDDVYSKVGSELVEAAMGDYNACIFAYGHTGSGKTFTILGSSSKRGLLPRCIVELFSLLAAKKQEGNEDSVTCSCDFYEVYNETIRDLLAPTHIRGKDRQRTVHAHPKLGVHIDGLSRSVVSTTEECLELIGFGNQMRAMAMTTMNEQSSRSHAIFTFRMEVEGQGSSFTFVDLAGREDQTASDNKAMQLREMCYINTSLFHLAHLITKLSEGALQKGSLSAFRNSKLTLLLSQALIGNCKTALIATMAPALEYFDDTLSTLQFAQQVKKVETQPQVNKKATKAMLRDLQEELARLQKELQQAKQGNTDTEQELRDAQAMISHLKASPQELLETSKRAKNQRMTIRAELGLHMESQDAPTSSDGQVVPFFTKLSDDASLQGCCNYFVTKTLRFGSSAMACDVVLQGVGVTPLMCLVECVGGQSNQVIVYLLGYDDDEDEESDRSDEASGSGLTDSDSDESEVFVGAQRQVPRVLVNGHPLTPDGNASITMEHGDCLVLGYAHAFRLVVPGSRHPSCITEEEDGSYASDAMGRRSSKRTRASFIAQDTLPDLSLQSALAEVGADASDQYKHVMPALLQYGMRPENEAVVNNLKLRLTKVCPLVDEANRITEEIFGSNVLRFQCYVLNDRPRGRDRLQLVVCVYECFNALANVHRQDSDLLSPRCLSPRSPGSAKRARASVRHGAGGRPSFGTSGLGRPSTKQGDSLLPRNTKSIFMSLGLTELDPTNPDAGLEDLGEDQLLYLWAVEKFLRRLREMREIYQAGCAMGDRFKTIRSQMRANRHLNPWHEAAVTEVKMITEGEGASQTTVGITSAKKESPREQARSRLGTSLKAGSVAESPQITPTPEQVKEPFDRPVPTLQLPMRSRSRGSADGQEEASAAEQPADVEEKARSDQEKKPAEKDKEEQEMFGKKLSLTEAKHQMAADQKSRDDRPLAPRISFGMSSARKDIETPPSKATMQSKDEVIDLGSQEVASGSSHGPGDQPWNMPTEQLEAFSTQIKSLEKHAESLQGAAEVLSMLRPLHTRLAKLEQRCDTLPEEVAAELDRRSNALGNSTASSALPYQSPRSTIKGFSASLPIGGTGGGSVQIGSPRITSGARETLRSPLGTPSVVRRMSPGRMSPTPISPRLLSREEAVSSRGQHAAPVYQRARFTLVRTLSPPQPPAPNFVMAPPSRAKGSQLTSSRSTVPPVVLLSPRPQTRQVSPPKLVTARGRGAATASAKRDPRPSSLGGSAATPGDRKRR